MIETMYDYRPERKLARIIDACENCGANIITGEEYYDIKGTVICEECIREYKKQEE